MASNTDHNRRRTWDCSSSNCLHQSAQSSKISSAQNPAMCSSASSTVVNPSSSDHSIRTHTPEATSTLRPGIIPPHNTPHHSLSPSSNKASYPMQDMPDASQPQDSPGTNITALSTSLLAMEVNTEFGGELGEESSHGVYHLSSPSPSQADTLVDRPSTSDPLPDTASPPPPSNQGGRGVVRPRHRIRDFCGGLCCFCRD
jgi:hypothetical protein